MHLQMNSNIIRIALDVAIVVLLVVVLFRGCQEVTPPAQMTPEEIEGIIKESFDTIPREQYRVIATEIEQVKQLLARSNGLSEQETEVLRRLVSVEQSVAEQNQTLTNYAEILTASNFQHKQIVYVIDSTGKRSPTPQFLKDLPLVINAMTEDEHSKTNVTYDMQEDSITTEVTTYDDLRLTQSVNESGEHIAIVDNQNPRTYTRPGTNIFKLDLPVEYTRRRFSVNISGGYYLTPSGFKPGVGIGVGYDVGKALDDVLHLVGRRKR